MTIKTEFLVPAGIEWLGALPDLLEPESTDPLAEQIDRNYQHGGGWSPFHGFAFDPASQTITYPEDEPLAPLVRMTTENETLYLYEMSWVLILQQDGSYEVARID